NWEWQHLVRASDDCVATLQGPEHRIAGRVRFSPDGRYLGAWFWTEKREGAVHVWRCDLGQSTKSADSKPLLVRREDGDGMFEFGGGHDELLRVIGADLSLWNLSQQREVRRVRLETEGTPDKRILFSRNGRSAFALNGQQWDTNSGRRVGDLSLLDRPVSLVQSDETGERMIFGLGDGTIAIRES